MIMGGMGQGRGYHRERIGTWREDDGPDPGPLSSWQSDEDRRRSLVVDGERVYTITNSMNASNAIHRGIKSMDVDGRISCHHALRV